MKLSTKRKALGSRNNVLGIKKKTDNGTNKKFTKKKVSQVAETNHKSDSKENSSPSSSKLTKEEIDILNTFF